jgi:Tat protein translocase TatB subunit
VFGSLGGSEVIVLFVLALLLFGPRRLPEIGKTIGKAVAEFRKASQDFRASLEREVEIEKIKDATRSVEASVQQALPRGSLLSDPDPTPPGPTTSDDDGNRAGA